MSVDETGRFNVVGLGNGEYVLRAESPGLATEHVDVLVRPGDQQVEVAVELFEAGAIEGRALDVSGRPNPRLTVIVSVGQPPGESQANTDAEGRYRIDGLHPGKCVVMFQDPQLYAIKNQHPWVQTVTVAPGETVRLDYRTPADAE